VPDRIVEVFAKGAAAKPSDRWASAAEFAQALKKANRDPLKWFREIVTGT
jgi:hypothetical protein